MAGINDLEIQALAGHKSGRMVERYSHVPQVMDYNEVREKLEKALTPRRDERGAAGCRPLVLTPEA
jgi:integrase